MTARPEAESLLKEAPAGYRVGGPGESSSMLDDSLAMTPWERILANDDIVNFGDVLRAAMEKRNEEVKKRQRQS